MAQNGLDLLDQNGNLVIGDEIILSVFLKVNMSIKMTELGTHYGSEIKNLKILHVALSKFESKLNTV